MRPAEDLSELVEGRWRQEAIVDPDLLPTIVDGH